MLRHLLLLTSLAFAFTALAALAEPSDLVRWRVEATYSRTEHDIPMDANCSYRLITHIFMVVEKEDSKHPGIRQITMSSLGKDPKKWDEQTQKFNRLSQGAHIVITVAAPTAFFKTAETGKAGILEVEAHHLEMAPPKEAANHTAEPASPSRGGSS